jgi:parvulin-like peptidyl-prolyl isomerase
MFFLFYNRTKIGLGISWVIALAFMAACTGTPSSTPIIAPGLTATAPTSTNSLDTATPTQQPTGTNQASPVPTVTPEPLAAEVNGQGIPIVEYRAELARYQAAQKNSATPLLSDKEQQQVVLGDMVDNLLLAQAAVQAGHPATDKDIQTEIDQLVNQLGSSQALLNWENAHGYTDDSFRQSLAISLSATWQRDQIISKAPDTADQVHAIQIMVYNEADAKIIYSRLQSGVDFATLAVKYDPAMGGDLDWFPQGFLTVPEVDQAAFSLTPGKYSEIIKSKVGFHIIQVIGRDPKHPLSPQTRAFVEKQVLQKWLDDAVSRSKINTLLP